MNIRNDANALYTLIPHSPTTRALKVVAELSALGDAGLMPELAWNMDPQFGATGTACGSDLEVLEAVDRWAEHLGAKAALVQPEINGAGPGWTVVHARQLGVDVTVGGRLTTPEVAW